MTVKIALKKKFNKNAATCFYTEYAKSVTCKTIPAAEIMAMGFDETDPHDQYVVVKDEDAKARSATATLTFLFPEQEGAT